MFGVAIRTLFVACAIALAAPMASVAASEDCGDATSVPPSDSHVAQYVESVPGSCGDNHLGGNGAGGGGGESLPSSTTDELSQLGSDGAAAAAIAELTSEPTAGSGTGAGGSSGGSETSSDEESTAAASANPALAKADGSAFTPLSETLTGSSDDGSGLGFLLPLLLGAVALAGVLFLIGRRRRQS